MPRALADKLNYCGRPRLIAPYPYDGTGSHLDPEGVDVGATDPADNHGEPPPPDPLPRAGAYAAYLPHSLGGSGRCRLEGMEVGCGFIDSLEATGMVGRVSGSNIRAIYDKSKKAYVGAIRPMRAASIPRTLIK